jgi:predicted nucleotidyltransferase
MDEDLACSKVLGLLRKRMPELLELLYKDVVAKLGCNAMFCSDSVFHTRTARSQ